jgi:hypothetical protein
MNIKKPTQPIQTGNGHDRLAAEELLHTFGGGSKTRIFVSPGKDLLELLMRTVFDNREQMVAAIMLYDKCRRFNFQRGMDDLKAFLAAQCSVQGRSTALALMAETGVLATGILAKDHMDMKTLKRKGAQQKDEAIPAE